MAEGTTSSVSKGCFLFKKNVTGSPRKRRYANAIDLIDRYDGESPENVSQRYDNFKQCWKQVKTNIQALESNSKIFSHIVEYVQSAHQKSNKSYEHGYINEIPTAVLITGVNMPDHDIIFSQLAKNLSQITPYIAVLQSKDCTTMKFIMKNMILQFMSSEEEDEEEEELHTSVHHKPRLSSYTMVQLRHWYKTRAKESQEEVSKKNKGTPKKFTVTENPPLVVILEDFEGFHPPVIQDFVSVCSQYTNDIPLVMVFGVATSVSAVHQVLPHSVSTLLSIERFQSQPSLTCLLEIISKVLMTAGMPFKLGHKVFRFLYENFLFHDFSLQNFSTGLQFCMMEHFYDNPVSVVCCEPEERESVITDLTHDELEIMRRRPSFRKYVESCEMKEQVLLLSDDDHTKEVIIKLLCNFDHYHKYFFPVLDCLHAITANLPKHPLGKRVRDVYELCLTSNIYDQEHYGESLSLLRIYAKDELLLLLQKCVEILTCSSNESCKELEKHRDQLTSFLEQFEKIGAAEVKQTEDTTTPVQPKVTTTKILSRFELQEKLKTAAKQKRKDSPFDQLRQEVVEYLDQLFREYLTCPQNMPLNEVMYFDSLSAVKQHLIGMPRVAIQTALTNPHHYLKCDCCEIDAGAIQDSLPDVSIAYKLHLECGRLINLYDWLQAFSVVIDPDSSNSKKKTPSKKKKKSNEELQARFIRAVSELQFIGFIKPTKRKTDHVQRLTWGGC